MKKVYIATPCYEENVSISYLMGLLDTCELLKEKGYEYDLSLTSGGSLIPLMRNKILQMFWESDADYLLCVDSDLGWSATSVIRLLEADKEVSGGVYPSKDGRRTYVFKPITLEDGQIVRCPTTKLLKAEYIPAGFMLLQRSAVQKLKEHYDELKVSNDSILVHDGGHYHALYDTAIIDGRYYGEDILFCKRLTDIGIDIWVDPFMQFTHGKSSGCLLETLTTER